MLKLNSIDTQLIREMYSVSEEIRTCEPPLYSYMDRIVLKNNFKRPLISQIRLQLEFQIKDDLKKLIKLHTQKIKT